MDMLDDMGGVDAQVLRHVVENYPDVNVIVSMEGLPEINLDRVIALREDKQFFVVDMHAVVNWVPYLRNRFIDATITYRWIRADRSGRGPVPGRF